jgi:hypothetical protein
VCVNGEWSMVNNVLYDYPIHNSQLTIDKSHEILPHIR